MTLDVTKFLPKWSKYIPHVPTAKQLAFLMLPHEEALFGGALGGGKSDVLLMAALQYVDIPGYAAIIFRQSLSDLKLPGALLDRIQKWLAPYITSKEVKYVASEHTFYFPTFWPDGTPGDPAKLVFGYIGDANIRDRYMSAEFQFVGFDELTTWSDDQDYVFMFTRIRQPICTIHKTDETGTPIWNPSCQYCQTLRTVPKRMRGATNPGNSGGTWVKNWFSIKPDPEKFKTRKEALIALQRGDYVRFVGTDKNKAFIPSFLEDNPYLDRKAYDVMLSRLTDQDKDRLRSGNWEIRPDSRFKRPWVKYYTQYPGQYILPDRAINHSELMRVFITVDPAASVRQGPVDTQVRTGAPSWTVISTWGLTHDGRLLWLDMVRFQKEIPDVVEGINKAYDKWKPSYIKIEYKGVGIGAAQYVALTGKPVVRCHKATDKIENSVSAMMLMKNGRIYFPENAYWLETGEDEIFGWTGLPGTEDDIVDTLSDAANDVAGSGDIPVVPQDAYGNSPSAPVYRVVPRIYANDGYR